MGIKIISKICYQIASFNPSQLISRVRITRFIQIRDSLGLARISIKTEQSKHLKHPLCSAIRSTGRINGFKDNSSSIKVNNNTTISRIKPSRISGQIKDFRTKLKLTILHNNRFRILVKISRIRLIIGPKSQCLR